MNKNKATLTITIPTFNSAKYLQKTLDCLKAQDCKDFSVLIVDDKSTDETRLIASQAGAKVLEKPLYLQKGAAVSLNYALRNIDTPCIAFIDSDAFLEKNWVSTMLLLLKSHEIIGAPIMADLENGLIAKIAGLEIESRYEKAPASVGHLSTCNLAFHTKLIENFKFDESLAYAYDHQLSFYLQRKKVPFFLTKKTNCRHRNKNSLFGYIYQQYAIASYHFLLARYMPKEAVRGDSISPSSNIFQPPLTLIFLASLFINWEVATISLGLLILLNFRFLQYLVSKKHVNLIPLSLGLLILRNLAWSAGLIASILQMFTKKLNKKELRKERTKREGEK